MKYVVSGYLAAHAGLMMATLVWYNMLAEIFGKFLLILFASCYL